MAVNTFVNIEMVSGFEEALEKSTTFQQFMEKMEELKTAVLKVARTRITVQTNES
jgi:predicted nucleotidyltransferase